MAASSVTPRAQASETGSLARCSGGRHRSRPIHDQPVVLGPPVAREVEHRLLVGAREIEVAAGHAELVLQGRAHGDRLAGGRDDLALADHVAALFPAALGHTHHPRAVLICPRPHDEAVVEIRQEVVLGRRRIVHRRVVAEEDHLHALETHDPVRLGPAAVIADAHAHEPAEGAPHAPAEVPHVEVALLQVLEGPPALVLGMAGEVGLPALAHDAPRRVNQDRGIEAPRDPAVDHELRVAEAHAQAQAFRLLEEGKSLRPRHLALEEGVDLRLILHPPAWEEGGEGELGKHHEVAAVGLGPLEKLDEPLDDLRTAVGPLNGPSCAAPTWTYLEMALSITLTSPLM